MRLPSIDAVLSAGSVRPLIERYGRMVVRDALRTLQSELRGQSDIPAHEHGIEHHATTIADRLDRSIGSRTAPVFNMTGVLLHSNLGRAALDAERTAKLARQASGQVLLEIDARTGGRGNRESGVVAALRALTGAESASIVNNNAAAVMLMLAALKRAGRNQVIVSRGELVEIGGSFRLPDIMRASGVKLVEVGSTNVTRPKDYADAINPRTAAILKVHTSNYSIEGYARAASLEALAPIAAHADIPLAMDLGSGCLTDLTTFGLPHEPRVSEAIGQGAKLVTFSGDKLLGSVQAGIVLGSSDLVARANHHPMKRALRLDKIRLALLEETLKAYQQPEQLTSRVPLFRILARGLPELEAAASRVRDVLTPLLDAGFACEVATHHCEMGSGSMPGARIPSHAVRINAPSQAALKRFDGKLRSLPVPVLGRIHAGALMLDVRVIEDIESLLGNLSCLNRA